MYVRIYINKLCNLCKNKGKKASKLICCQGYTKRNICFYLHKYVCVYVYLITYTIHEPIKITSKCK